LGSLALLAAYATVCLVLGIVIIRRYSE
jgi:hypothetical protein